MEIAEFAGRNISQLTGGQRQRVALARSLVVDPLSVLGRRRQGSDAVRAQEPAARNGHHFVHVTPSLSKAFFAADRVVMMSRGKIEQIGTPQDIYRAPRTRFVADFLGSSNLFQGVVVRDAHGRPCHRRQQRGFRPAGRGGGRGPVQA